MKTLCLIQALAGAGLVAGAGCSMSSTVKADPIAQHVGEHVTVDGTAGNAKAGAVVLVDGAPIYLEAIASWPDGFDGREVRVTGTLRERKLIPDPVNAAGEIVQGATGTQLVIEAPSFARR